MDLLDLLLTATVVLTWALGVQLAVWWPYKTVAGSPRVRALHAIRYAVIGLALSVALLALILFGLQPSHLVRVILAAVGWTAFLQTPLALTALAVARGERMLAIIGSLLALCVASLFLWLSFYIALVLLTYIGLLSPMAFLAFVLSGGAVASLLELYVAIRQPRARWDERHEDLV